jgi:predicted metal-dependent phosphoesterase TrpH
MRRSWVAAIAAALVIVLVVAFVLQPAAPWSKTADGPGDQGDTGTNDSVAFTIAYNPYDLKGTWYKGQLHCHSTNSDGRLAPAAVVSRYAGLGFDFIALTDHENITKANGSILVLGEEYGKGSVESSSYRHLNGINVSWVPLRYASEQQRVDNITAQNGLASLNHPTDESLAYPQEVLTNLTNYTDLEVYNANHDTYAPTAWDEVLSSGKMVWGVATDDAHQARQFGKAWIEVRMPGPVTTGNVIDAIKHGSFYATQGPLITDVNLSDGNLTVRSPGAESITYIGRGGAVLDVVHGDDATYQIRGNESYVRAEVLKNGSKAWTQPVFVQATTNGTSSVAQSDPQSILLDALCCTIPPSPAYSMCRK